MAENQEGSPDLQKEVKPLEIKDQDPLKKAEDKSHIVSCYQELKDNVGNIKDNINVFLDAVRIDDQNLPNVKSVTLSDLDQQVNTLNQKEGLTNTQYLQESQNIKVNTITLKREYDNSSTNLGQKIITINNQISEINNQLDYISGQPKLKKTFSSLESFILQRKKNDLEMQKTNFENQKLTIDAKKSELQRMTEEIDKKRQGALSDEMKKNLQEIKKAFPNIKLSVLVSDAAMSGKLSADMLIQKLSESKIKSKREENIEVNIIKSATGDHYTEFGGGARTAGKRKVSGILIDS